LPRKQHKKPIEADRDRSDTGPGSVRIVGGEFRGRKLPHSGDERTRPMKDRVREAVFNLLSNSVRGSHVIDLFAGTGALGIEALSRGAARATLIECHFPTVSQIQKNLNLLGAQDRAQVVGSDTFYWARTGPTAGPEPWLVFVSPPYEFYVSRQTEMLDLIIGLLGSAPPQSTMVVEADQRFDMGSLPHAGDWDVRTYSPAVIAIYRKRTPDAPNDER
jgi:16S rRNA (guanine966-N2)-methyltransferase